MRKLTTIIFSLTFTIFLHSCVMAQDESSEIAVKPHAETQVAGKIACVDMNVVFNEYYKTAEKEQEIREQEINIKTKINETNTRLKVLRRERKQLQETAMNLSIDPETRAEARKKSSKLTSEILERDKNLQEFKTIEENRILSQYLKIRQEIIEEIKMFLEEYAIRNDYAIIIDISGMSQNYIPTVVYHAPKTNITAEVLNELNKVESANTPETATDNTPSLNSEE